MTDTPDFLDATALAIACRGGLWADIDVVGSTGSTNADLAGAARAGAPAGRVLVSAHQSSGRGRLARSWEAPPDTSVACSVLVAPRRPLADWGWLPLLVGVAVAEGVRAATGLDAALKWPNDVLVGERKLAGILCESVPLDDRALAVLGFGVNISLRADQLPVPTATSTRLAGSDVGATAVTAAVLQALETRFTHWDAGGDVTLAYRRRCTTLGRDVRVDLRDEQLTGRAVDVDGHGGLVVETQAGPRTVVAGDVVHLR